MVQVYSVLNIDIKNSRNLEDRAEMQKSIKHFLKELSLRYEKVFVAPATFTLGDEWQIVLNAPSYSYNVFKEVQWYLKGLGIQCYGGLGIGTITTSLSMDTREMDGNAFIYAREALNISKTKNRFYNIGINAKENRFFFQGKNVDIEHGGLIGIEGYDEVAVTEDSEANRLTINRIINTIIENNEVIESRYSSKQMEVIELYKKHGSYSEIVKDNPKMTKAGISRKLNDANYFLTMQNRQMISLLIEKYISEIKR